MMPVGEMGETGSTQSISPGAAQAHGQEEWKLPATTVPEELPTNGEWASTQPSHGSLSVRLSL